MNKREQIIEYGKSQGKSQEQIDAALAKFDASNPTKKSEPGLGSRLSQPFTNAADAITNTGQYEGQSAVQRGTRAAAEVIHSPLNTAFQVLPEGARSGLKAAGDVVAAPFRAASEALSNTKLLKEIGDLEAQGFITKENAPELYNIREALGTSEAAGQIAGDLTMYSAFSKGRPKTDTKAVESNIDRQNRITTDQLTNSKIMDQAGGKNPNILSQAEQQGLVDLPEFPVQPQQTTVKAGLTPSPVSQAVGAITRPLGNAVKGTEGSVGKNIGNAVRDIVPSNQALIDHSVAQAFQLAKSDVVNIQKSSGNNVGRWIADNNLIGGNSKETIQNITRLTNDNYDKVRQTISSVPAEYQQYNVPRYVDALKVIKEQIDDVPGLEAKAVEVENLLKKEALTLEDVQNVKELLDKHFDLYKVTGDVKAGASKQGVSNMRYELKQFIEKEAKKYTGEDIKEMNNSVQTGKSLLRAIETRDAPGLRPWQTIGDFGTFGVGSYILGGPIGGAALYIVKKIWETPTMQLKFARFLDGLNDAQKAKVRSTLNEGEIPPELGDFVEIVD